MRRGAARPLEGRVAAVLGARVLRAPVDAVHGELLELAALRVVELVVDLKRRRRDLLARHARAPLLRAGELMDEHVVRVCVRLENLGTAGGGVDVEARRDAGEVEERVRDPLQRPVLRRSVLVL
jgi:hypothetical protein